MRSVQIVLDEASLRALDREARRSKLNRSALMRKALAYYLRRRRMIELEKQQRRGRERAPLGPGGVDRWGPELARRPGRSPQGALRAPPPTTPPKRAGP